jgi:hypothetical protein
MGMEKEKEKIQQDIIDYCLKNEGISVNRTTDSGGNECIEWQTALILEVMASDEQEKDKSLSRQSVSVQFDVSFDMKTRKIIVFLQWGKIEPSLWTSTESQILGELKKEGNIHVRYYGDRQVIELGLVYPFHEFDFSYVYKEIISHFGFINGIFFKRANEK